MEDITVLVSSSPIISHPSTEIIDQTIASVRERLPDSPMIIMQDGIREEQEVYAERYQQYLNNLTLDNNTTLLIMPHFLHQAGTTAVALKQVTTPYILFMEHDTPLTGDIPFKELCEIIASGRADIIRFMIEASILEEHQYLMLGEEVINSQHLTRSRQWSQRPHLASSAFYRKILDEHFPPSARTFIEDKMYGIMEVAINDRGMQGWEEYKLWIYTPQEGSMKRSENLDGRGSDPKYELNFD